MRIGESEASNQIAQGIALGIFMPGDDSAPEGQKHFPPNDNAFALSGRTGCYVAVPQGVTLGWWFIAPIGAHSALRLGGDTMKEMPIGIRQW